jgi:hypothetical protein
METISKKKHDGPHKYAADSKSCALCTAAKTSRQLTDSVAGGSKVKRTLTK